MGRRDESVELGMKSVKVIDGKRAQTELEKYKGFCTVHENKELNLS